MCYSRFSFLFNLFSFSFYIYIFYHKRHMPFFDWLRCGSLTVWSNFKQKYHKGSYLLLIITIGCADYKVIFKNLCSYLSKSAFIKEKRREKRLALTGVDPSFPKHEPISTRECKRHRSQCVQRAVIVFVHSKSQSWTTLD
jgi:hypothetical protein